MDGIPQQRSELHRHCLLFHLDVQDHSVFIMYLFTLPHYSFFVGCLVPLCWGEVQTIILIGFQLLSPACFIATEDEEVSGLKVNMGGSPIEYYPQVSMTH